VFNWAVTAPVNLSLKSGKKLFNHPILGGMDTRGVIVNGTPQEIEAEVHRIIRTAGPKNLIVGADCTLPTGVSIDNIRIAIEATGTYPLAEAGTH
ncbi:MAG: uroporphyrinogen decarboxylase family protein, partial [Brevefilum sp.]